MTKSLCGIVKKVMDGFLKDVNVLSLNETKMNYLSNIKNEQYNIFHFYPHIEDDIS